jgi:hypothetical protein
LMVYRHTQLTGEPCLFKAHKPHQLFFVQDHILERITRAMPRKGPLRRRGPRTAKIKEPAESGGVF